MLWIGLRTHFPVSFLMTKCYCLLSIHSVFISQRFVENNREKLCEVFESSKQSGIFIVESEIRKNMFFSPSNQMVMYVCFAFW